MGEKAIQAPKGTRDFYPQDMLRRRYIERAWRDTAIRHGFEEIDGPTFESRELYERKSGEGILSEMFGVFSGKDEAEVRSLRESGLAPFALRPEFTPTLARMYAAKAGGLPKPCRWFWQQNCYRAEKPQRGRLREFLQWNCDIIGEGSASIDAELVSTCVALLAQLGLVPSDCNARFNNRIVVQEVLTFAGASSSGVAEGFALLDRRAKVSHEAFAHDARAMGLDLSRFDSALEDVRSHLTKGAPMASGVEIVPLRHFREAIAADGIAPWCEFDPQIARGLAYYTGMVFEVHETGGKERAIAGGGRYDNLIELFGGPPTPAVGFGMGDVVLLLVLEDRGLMPEGKDLLHALSLPGASLRPDVFVISNGQPESDAQVRPLVARLRRGSESARWRDRADRKPWDVDRYLPVDGTDRVTAPPLHARHTSKATKNIGKLLQEASASHARFAAIIESAGSDGAGLATLKNLDTREEMKDVPLAEIGARVAGK